MKKWNEDVRKGEMWSIVNKHWLQKMTATCGSNDEFWEEWEGMEILDNHARWEENSKILTSLRDFPGGSDGKSVCLQCRKSRFDPWVGKIPWRRKRQHTPVLLPWKFHGRRSHGRRSHGRMLQSMGLQIVGHDWATSLSLTSLRSRMMATLTN